MLEAQTPPTLPGGQEFDVVESTPGKRGILWVLIGVAVLVFLGLGAFLVWRYLLSTPRTTDAVNFTLAPDLNLLPEEEIPANINSPLVNELPASPDVDHDGLTADEELTFGTSDQDPDSDDDALNDREEVMIYKTDPLNPDTDNDTYLDGDEVKGLYNPNGPGKLFSLENLQP